MEPLRKAIEELVEILNSKAFQNLQDGFEKESSEESDKVIKEYTSRLEKMLQQRNESKGKNS